MVAALPRAPGHDPVSPRGGPGGARHTEQGPRSPTSRGPRLPARGVRDVSGSRSATAAARMEGVPHRAAAGRGPARKFAYARSHRAGHARVPTTPGGSRRSCTAAGNPGRGRPPGAAGRVRARVLRADLGRPGTRSIPNTDECAPASATSPAPASSRVGIPRRRSSWAEDIDRAWEQIGPLSCLHDARYVRVRGPSANSAAASKVDRAHDRRAAHRGAAAYRILHTGRSRRPRAHPRPLLALHPLCGGWPRPSFAWETPRGSSPTRLLPALG